MTDICNFLFNPQELEAINDALKHWNITKDELFYQQHSLKFHDGYDSISYEVRQSICTAIWTKGEKLLSSNPKYELYSTDEYFNLIITDTTTNVEIVIPTLKALKGYL